MSSRREIKRYQLQWKPSFPANRNGDVRIYVMGEKKKYLGDTEETAAQTEEVYSYGYDDFSLQEIIRVAYNSTLILPFNSNVAMAQEYTPEYNNKIVKYNTLGGNSVTTFGAGIKTIGLRIRVIKAGRHWESYIKGLEAVAYLSANQARYYGGLYLLAYDAFRDGTQRMAGRYKVSVQTLSFKQRSDSNTTVDADLQLVVLRDYGHYRSSRNRVWGSL